MAQTITGIVRNADSNNPVEYANIGVIGKDVGTVSDELGRFILTVSPEYNSDTILVSVVGYKPYKMRVADLRGEKEYAINLKETAVELKAIIVNPRHFKQRKMGVTTKSKAFQAGFEDNLLGYECGIRMKVKKTAVIQQVRISIAQCTYPTLFYRLNIYQVEGKNQFRNVLREPIYLDISKTSIQDEIQLDLSDRNIVVDGDFLVTLEHVKDLGKGSLTFCSSLSTKTYFRKTSQGQWKTVPVGIGISVVANVEQ